MTEVIATKEVKTVNFEGEQYIRILDVISTLIDMGFPKLAKSFAEMKEVVSKVEGT